MFTVEGLNDIFPRVNTGAVELHPSNHDSIHNVNRFIYTHTHGGGVERGKDYIFNLKIDSRHCSAPSIRTVLGYEICKQTDVYKGHFLGNVHISPCCSLASDQSYSSRQKQKHSMCATNWWQFLHREA